MREQQAMKLFHGITNISDEIIQEALDAKPSGTVYRPWIRWGAAAACVCLIIAGAFYGLPSLRDGATETVDMSRMAPGLEGTDASEYDGDLENGQPFGTAENSESFASDRMLPYTETRYFSDWQEQMEKEGIIPAMDEGRQFTCAAHYNEDGSLYSVEFNWHQNEPYSDLKITAAPQPVEEFSDCVTVEVDENGNPVESEPSVTKRDGISVTTEGKESREKTVTFQKDGVWYKVFGSWNDAFSAVNELVDWTWVHPVDLQGFPMEEGDRYTVCTLAEYPEAFSGYLPDFASFGLSEVETTLILKNGVPQRFEGHYSAQEGQLDSVHWCLETVPDQYDTQRSVGALKDLTKSKVQKELKAEHRITFTWEGNCITVYSQESDDAVWDLIQSLKSR